MITIIIHSHNAAATDLADTDPVERFAEVIAACVPSQ
jgi:hypothetical protein